MPTSKLLQFTLILCTCLLHANGEYYWRSWTPGSAPKNAITGRDYRGTSYIVEAIVPGWGVYYGQAFISQSYINITALNETLSVTKSSGSLKVLCADEDSLAWYPTSKTSLDNEMLTAAIQPVTGGLDVNERPIYIGKYVNYNLRTVHFGSVISLDHRLLYNSNNFNNAQFYYEILIVNKHCSDR